jgi:hypothetical protein
VAARERIVDECDARSVCGIELVEEPAAEQRHPRRREISVRRDRGKDRRLPAGGSGGAAFDREGIRDIGAAPKQWQGGRDADGPHAGYGFKSLQHLLRVSRTLCGRVVPIPDENLQRHDFIHRKARIYAQELVEAAQQQAGPDQQHQRQRDLRDDERAPQPMARGTAGRRLPGLLQTLLQIGF